MVFRLITVCLPLSTVTIVGDVRWLRDCSLWSHSGRRLGERCLCGTFQGRGTNEC